MTLGFRPLAGCGLFQEEELEGWMEDCFRPLAGCGLFLQVKLKDYITKVSVPLRGVGCFARSAATQTDDLVSVPLRGVGCFRLRYFIHAYLMCFRPLAGCGLFLISSGGDTNAGWFPSPCGVWVVSGASGMVMGARGCFRPLAGCGLFHDELEARLVKEVSVPLRGVGCFGKAAHSFWCNRKKNCQLCYFIVSYWQMFINSKLRNCKVPCEAHKTAT